MRLLAFLDMCQSQYNLLLGLRLCGLAWSNENGKPQEMLTTWLKSELLSFSVCYLLFVIIDCRMFEYLLYESFICSAPKWINRKKSRHMSTIVPKWKYYTFILRQAWRTLWNPNYRCINYIFSHHFGCLAGILETKSRICIFFGIVDIGHVGWIVFAINPALPSCSSACQKLIDCDAKNNKNWYARHSKWMLWWPAVHFEMRCKPEHCRCAIYCDGISWNVIFHSHRDKMSVWEINGA